jgi:hypothetical protein
MLTRWIKRLHIYAGLLNFSILMIFGIAGLAATFRVERRFDVSVETRPFLPPANATDYDAAMAAYATLDLPLASPPPRNAVHRDANHNVSFMTYAPSGPRVVTLVERDQQVRVERRRNRLWHFFDNLHATTSANSAVDLRMRMWTWYVEFSIWSLIWMSISGIYLWLSARPAHRWAQAAFALGAGGFGVLYWVFR